MNASSLATVVMLLVEDNPADVVFLREAIEAAGVPLSVHVVSDGAEAMDFLHRESLHANAPRPDVVVLDLNLPIKKGHEVLAEMAADTELNTIPVAVLTTSTSESCVCEMYPPGRCLYFVKTDQFGKLKEIVRQITDHAATGK